MLPRNLIYDFIWLINLLLDPNEIMDMQDEDIMYGKNYKTKN